MSSYTLKKKPAIVAQQQSRDVVVLALFFALHAVPSSIVAQPEPSAQKTGYTPKASSGTIDQYDDVAIRMLVAQRHVKKQERRLSNIIADTKIPDNFGSLPWDIIDILSRHGITADFINSADEDDLTIEFSRGSLEYTIEFNTGKKIVFLIQNGKKFYTWDLNPNEFLEKFYEKLA